MNATTATLICAPFLVTGLAAQGAIGKSAPAALPPTVGPATALPTCATTIKDVTTKDCIAVDSTPTLGRLYPLGPEFNIDGAGNVGIGTTTPGAKLEVAGTARMTDTLTLAPSGDRAVDISTGSIYKGGALFIHTKGVGNTAIGAQSLAGLAGGYSNTAIGAKALLSNTTGNLNTACGADALLSNTTGYGNTAGGVGALFSNTTGYNNTAGGVGALLSNTTGSYNTASGVGALFSNTTGYSNTASGVGTLQSNTSGKLNTATGVNALYSNDTGYSNTASGVGALFSNTLGNSNTASGAGALSLNSTGSYNTASGGAALLYNTTGARNTGIGQKALLGNQTGSGNIALGYDAGSSLLLGDNIAIGNPATGTDAGVIRIGTAGTQTTAFMAGIRGVMTANADAVSVLIDSQGQLGTVSSSRRFKEDIEDMGASSDRLLRLRAVTFRYKNRNAEGNAPLEYGLVAEEVAEIFPELVVYDEQGRPESVKYHLLGTMLLNELQKHAREANQEVEALRAAHARELDALRSRLARLERVIASVAPQDSR